MTVSLFDAMQNGTHTTNGMPAFKSTNSALLDFFTVAGDSRNTDVSDAFNKAYAENQEVAVRTLLWTRDVRGGAGERNTFRKLLGILARSSFEHMSGVMKLIPEVGRWDDLFVLFGTKYEAEAKSLILKALHEGNALCAKWMPRQGPIAANLRITAGYTPKQWRKTLVNLTQVVETPMCAKKWDSIEYPKVPSKAIGKYAKAFGRNDKDRFTAFKTASANGEVKVNAGAVYPYDVTALLNHDPSLAEVQWKNLPDYCEGSNERAICVVDVSSSMMSPVAGRVTAMDVAISLGIYTSERLSGVFKNTFITFTSKPRIVKFAPNATLASRVKKCNEDVGYSTNIEGVFDAILSASVTNKVSEDQMPTKVLMISDMQFNSQVRGAGLSAVPMIQAKYAAAGYKMPALVFWNVNAAGYGNKPATVMNRGVIMVSGFSPSILKGILSGSTDSFQMMLDTVGNVRYNYIQASKEVAEVQPAKPKRNMYAR